MEVYIFLILSYQEKYASGFYGSPIRYDGGPPTGYSIKYMLLLMIFTKYLAVSGGFERSIAIYRTSLSFVAQARSWLPNHIGYLIT